MTVSDEHDTAPLRISVERGPGRATVVRVGGELDYVTAGDLRAALLEALTDASADVVLDLAELRFLDSSGMGAIVSGWQRARVTGARYVVRGTPDVIAEQFEMTGLSQVLTFDEDTRAERDGSAA